MSASRPTSLATRLATSAAPATERGPSAFVVLDETVAGSGEYGCVRVCARDSLLAPLARHLQRRAELAGRNVLVAGVSPVADAWRELAVGLGVFDTTEAAPLARSMARAAAGCVVVVAQRHETAWGQGVAECFEQACLDEDARVLLVSLRDRDEHSRLPQPFRAERTSAVEPSQSSDGPRDLTIEIDALSPRDSRRWWDAVVLRDEVLSRAPLDQLDALDSWWESARHRPAPAERSLPDLSPDALQLLDCALRAELAMDVAQLDALGTTAARRELVSKGLLLADRAGRLSPRPGATTSRTAGPEQDRKLAAVLMDRALAGPEPDPWITMRAAELSVAAGDADRAERCALDALGRATQSAARNDLWRRWDCALEALGDGEDAAQLDRLVRSAERALELGDGDRADELARRAIALDAERFDVLVLRGRSSAARGDLTTASLALLRAISLADDDAERARAAAVMSEVRYQAGDQDEAGRYGEDAVRQAGELTIRLDARNVLGKLLLGSGQFAAAEEHFAQDAHEAASAGEVEGELRARLNQAIAALQQGRRDDARRMYNDVLADGERHGSLRGIAYALANLATIAIMELSFEEALSLSERAIEVRHQLGERIGLVRPITNLADLRLQLGLVDEAEQALRFGLQACGPELPASRYAYFAIVAARIQYARGNTAEAARQLAVARSGAAGAGDGTIAGVCELLGMRIALEDGDLGRAESALAAARARTPRAAEHPELNLLDATLLRACGQPFEAEAQEALRLAQRADDTECAREAFLLLFQAARLRQDELAADRFLDAALTERDRIAGTLPPALRSRLLARRDLTTLAELEADRDRAEEIPTQLPDPAVPAGRGRPRGTAERPIVGDTTVMQSLRSNIKRVARTDATVLVNGETGTGKELVAEAIHRDSRRSRGPLVKVNCAALVETLLLSELFGHERGAFTGASSRRRGRFELAEGGTLFLDEIGDISARTQVALLRVLQDGTYERVGGTTTLRSNVRIVCATHRDLRAMVERGEFREDLYYRLCGVVLEAPPLRDRLADLPALAEALLRQSERSAGVEFKPLSRQAMLALAAHGWPGNVRELDNALRVAALFARGPEIQVADFTENVEGLRHLADAAVARSSARGSIHPPASAGDGSSSPGGFDGAGPETLPAGQGPMVVAPPAGSTELVYAEVRGGTSLADMKRKLERECIARALVETSGNITRAAALLGMKRPRLSQLVKQYQLGTVLEEMKS